MKSLLLVFLVLNATQALYAAQAARTISFVVDPRPGRSAQHGIEQLGEALRASGWTTQVAGDADRETDAFMILAGTTLANGPAARALRAARVELPSSPEARVVKKLTLRGKSALVVCGADERGLMYALLEISEQVRANADATRDPLGAIREISDAPSIREPAPITASRH